MAVQFGDSATICTTVRLFRLMTNKNLSAGNTQVLTSIITTKGKGILHIFMKKHNFNNIPAELRKLVQWVLWLYEYVDGKQKKAPYSPTGLRASVTNSETWSSFEDVVSAYETGDYAGIGFVFTKDDPFIGIDFDDCVIDSIPNDDVYNWISKFGSYAEFSPSKTGIHIIVRSTLKIQNIKTSFVEIYQDKRYLTFTGETLNGYDD